jgi:hypothetical protein
MTTPRRKAQRKASPQVQARRQTWVSQQMRAPERKALIDLFCMRSSTLRS